ncbi:MAG: hypothetical protein JSS90_08435 [Bacteroidetes bacterium]|jgi:hypothetical protein|nr:hypothetical protein [Bacteroidota bacterium]
MKNFLLLNALIFSFCTGKAQLINLKNMSAEWVRCGARNAAVSGTDLVIYNPAALSFVQEGFYINVGNQAYLPAISQTTETGNKYQNSKDISYIHPDLLLAYHKKNWAFWGGAFLSAGTPALDYSEGNYFSHQLGESLLAGSNYDEIKNHSVKTNSDYYTAAAGFSLRANDNLSFAFGGRYVYAIQTEKTKALLTGGTNNADAAFELNDDDRASGYGITFGIHAKPYERFNISLRLESNIKLNFKRKSEIKNNSEVLSNVSDYHYRNDLPGIAAVGFGYDLTSGFRMTAEANYYFQQMAQWGETSDGKRLSTLAGDAINFGGGLEWKWCKLITWSAGATYSMPLFNDMNVYYSNSNAMVFPYYENFTVNTGFALNVRDVRINLGFAKSFFTKDKTVQMTESDFAGEKIKLNNDVMLFALGFDFRF